MQDKCYFVGYYPDIYTQPSNLAKRRRNEKDNFLSWQLCRKVIKKGRKIDRKRHFVQSKFKVSCIDRKSNLRSTEKMKPMQVYVSLVSGRTIAIDIKPFDTIKNIKERIREKVGISTRNQKLFFGRHELKDENLVRNYNIQNGTFLRFDGHLYGGMENKNTDGPSKAKKPRVAKVADSTNTDFLQFLSKVPMQTKFYAGNLKKEKAAII